MVETFTIEAEAEAESLIRELESLSEVLSVTQEPNSPKHKFESGDYAIDTTEPTPSPEANTVEIVETYNTPANQFTIRETGKTVAQHNPTFPKSDLVVAGRYPNMGGDQVFHFPESRLRKA